MSAIDTAHPVVGALTPFAEQLASMFQAFHTGTVHGLAAVRGERLDILAIAAVNPGHMSAFEVLPALDGRSNPCACCPPIPALLSLDDVIAVGFGSAYCSRDGEEVLRELREGEWPTVAEAELLAAADPGHDWQIVLFGPLHGEVYQRQGEGRWVLVESNQGFA